MNTPPQSQDPAPEPSDWTLPLLRAFIDAIDHDLLNLLARRNALVAEVAAYKRQNRVPIRDATREREIISDRRDRATPLGLPPDLIESLFRLILWGSRDRQAALRAEVPMDVAPKTVAIIGGHGGMGRCLTRLFRDLGHAVVPADVDTSTTPEQAAAISDVVIISVPINRTTDVIGRLGPLVRDDAILMDVTSIKTAPMEAMLSASKASVVATHPLFGPSVHSVQGQRVVACRGRGDEAFDWVCAQFRARGLIVVGATPEQHDRAMSVVQVLVHFATEVMGKTLSDLGVDIKETLVYTSPIYLMELLMTARHFAQSPDLYREIQSSNQETPRVMDAFVSAAEGLRNIVTTNDADAFTAMFEEARKVFDSFTDQAMEQSDFLIDRLVERG
jgi:chorismate mutase / prephenate dehydrogenase